MTRILIIALLIVLPLRGWTADNMAIHMAGGAPLTRDVAVTMPTDCPMLMAPADHATKSLGCKSCQLCMAWVSVAPTPLVSGPAAHHPEPVNTARAFVSADVVQYGKPPIS